MEKNELDTLLLQHELKFFWVEDRKEWWLSGKSLGDGQKTEPKKALNIEAAQASAVNTIKTNLLRPKSNNSSFPELDALLFKYNMSFHWSDPRSNWFLMWQAKGSNMLVTSKPRYASSRWDAQIDAAELISTKLVDLL